MNDFICQDCNKAFSSSEELRKHTRTFKNRARQLLIQLKDAWAHKEEYQSTTPLSDDGDISTEDDTGDRICPHPECENEYATRWNLQRHYNSHVKIEEFCAICKSPYDRLSTLISHTESCKRKKGESEDTARATEVVRRLNKRASRKLNERLTTTVDAKDTPVDSLSLYTDETYPARKRRCIDRNSFAGACPADQTDGSEEVHKGGIINGARPQNMVPFIAIQNPTVGLSSNLTTDATLAEAGPVSPLNAGPILSHSETPRAPFLSQYNLDESQHGPGTATNSQLPRAPFLCHYNLDESQHRPEIATNSQLPKAPFLSGYNVDESQNHPALQTYQASQSQLYNSNQSFNDVNGFSDNDLVTGRYARQIEQMRPAQMTTAPQVSAHELSHGAMDGNRIDAQAAKNRGAMYGSPENVQYHADSRLYTDSNLGTALPVGTLHLSYTS